MEKKSYIKLNGNKIEGFSALNGVVTPLTIEEVNTINLLKLSDDKSYLGKENDYDIYVDNISGLKHYFKDDKEDLEVTWENNGEDALLYKDDKLDNIKNELKSIPLKDKMIFLSRIAYLIVSVSFLAFSIQYNPSSNKSHSSQEYNIEYGDNVSLIINTDEIWENVTCEQIETCIKDNENLTEEEKEIYGNKKLLQDVVSYYENTNMNVLMPLKYDELQTEYYYEENEFDAYYDITQPNKIFVNTYYDEKYFYDNKVHEYVHLLQSSYIYTYIIEASAEVISFEYDDRCTIDSYLNAVKNLKILMEIVGPEPIWKLNFSGDDTD